MKILNKHSTKMMWNRIGKRSSKGRLLLWK